MTDKIPSPLSEHQNNLVWRLAQLESARRDDVKIAEIIEKDLNIANIQIKDLVREVIELKRLATKAQRQADYVAKTLEVKEQQEAAEARARGLVAKWLQIFTGGVILVLTLWSNRWFNALEQIKAIFGSVP